MTELTPFPIHPVDDAVRILIGPENEAPDRVARITPFASSALTMTKLVSLTVSPLPR